MKAAARLLAASLLLAAAARPVAAAGEFRLLMFDAPDCAYCARFEAEIGGAYDRTEEGRLAPLERHALAKGAPADVVLAEPVLYTPTFVLVEAGREVGRITGYPGDEFFWPLLADLLPSRR